MRFFPLWLVEIETIPSPRELWQLLRTLLQWFFPRLRWFPPTCAQTSPHPAAGETFCGSPGLSVQLPPCWYFAPPVICLLELHQLCPFQLSRLGFHWAGAGSPSCAVAWKPPPHSMLLSLGTYPFSQGSTLLFFTLTSAWEPLSHVFCSVFWLFDVHRGWESGFSNSVVVGSRIQPPTPFFPPILFFSY